MEQVNNIQIDNFSSFFFTGSWTIIDILIILIGLDVISGVIKATREHTIKSSVANIGLAKKVGILMVFIVANLADIVFKADGMVVNGTVAFYIIGEAVSILENCSVIGVPLPELLTKRLGITDDKNIKN